LQIQDDTGVSGLGRQNTSFGAFSSAAVTSGYNNTSIGWLAGNLNSTGYQNTVIGSKAAEDNTNCVQFTAVGYRALWGITSGGYDTAVGAVAGQMNPGGGASNGENCYFGNQAGRQSTANSTAKYIIVGAQSGSFAPVDGSSNYIGLGYDVALDAVYVPQTNRTVIGNSSTVDTILYGVTITPPTTVGALPVAAVGYKGARAFVTDANAATFGTTAASGGANNVPVYCDGTNWKIG
jgi:hypothetical protein